MFTSRVGLSINAIRRFASSVEIPGAGTSTGIEHALRQKQLGVSNKQDFKDYKCIDYLNYSTFSFYHKEIDISGFRVAQPSNKKPDVEPKFKNA